ncbi:hypothetical protein [Haliangium ochraceum]|uniref:Uncharacterized protein n=1 Tax=Haliangium ochraceum (strain DSM 14365 / JCM 11303 / SMP-2) TaxID=502025 RepID=D0LIS8_HALO1|nr:hypothetical protein [Haliangium ochraceum]ACY12957.1 hypothetical protein Hoch_0316 [Haliangium ochraceum DSM 14365]
MSSKRWQRGRRPPGFAAASDVQQTLGSLLRSTLQQVSAVKDVALRQARSSFEQLDGAVLQRKRQAAMAELGELVWELANTGRLGEIMEHPDLEALLRDVQEIEERMEQEATSDSEAVSSASWTPPPPSPSRASSGAAGNRRGKERMRVWRPNLADLEQQDAAHGDDDRGHGHAQSEPASAAPEAAPQAASRRGRRSRGRSGGGGGIAFVDSGPEDDEDLSEYMNDDDVPRQG